MSKYNTISVLEQYLKNDISLDKVKNNQIESIDICRKQGFFQRLQLSIKIKNLYKITEKDKKIFITSELKNSNTIFIYSCGVNDFLKVMNTDLGKMLNKKETDNSIKKIIFKIKNNLDSIIKINYRVEIYVLGLYIPTTFNYIRKRVNQPIKHFNEALENLCNNYNNVYFVDNSNLTKKEMAFIDWHPNYKGQCLIGKNIIDLLK